MTVGKQIRASFIIAAITISVLLAATVPQSACAEAWVKTDMGMPAGGNNRFFGAAVGDGDRDNQPEVYFAAREGGGLFQYTYDPAGGTWSAENLGPGSPSPNGTFMVTDAVAFGDGDDSGDQELYVLGFGRGIPGVKAGVYQYFFSGGMWRNEMMASINAQGTELALGDGNDDNRTEVYGSCSDGHIYMYYKMGSWNSQDIGNATPAQGQASTSMESVAVGDGDNDGLREVYGSAATGWVYRFNYNPATSSWTRTDVGQGATGKAGSSMASIAIGDVDGDSQNELYGASANNATIYMFKYNFKTVMWDRTTLVSLGTSVNALGLDIGDGNSDGQSELFAGTSNNQVYMIRYSRDTFSWGSSSVGSGNGPINDVAVGSAMGTAGQVEVYAACGDGHGYQFLVDRTPPANPEVWSDTHPVPGTWYANSVVHMLWKDVGKDPSGIDGYSFVWDSLPTTIPDAFKEVEEAVHDINSPALSPGKWFFHIRTRDNALNWNASANHFGPICIGSAPDTVPPTISDVSVSGITDNLAVVSWSTNEPADSLVEYGSTDNYGLKAQEAGMVLAHSIALTGLSPTSTYHYRVGSKDASGNGPSWSGDFTFKTLAAPDKTPPVISNVKAGGVTDRVALISWETDEPADSSVEYGTQASYGSVKSDGSVVLLHEVTLSGLEGSTTYHFRVRSTDATGNGPSMSQDYTFATLATPDRTPPQISNVRVEGITNSSATVLWDTDELSDSFVEYGLSSTFGLSSADRSFTTRHSIFIQGLSADRLYHYRVMSADSSANTGIGAEMTFRTEKEPAEPDTTPPKISGVNVSGITNMRAVVMWTTDELATSEVDYGRDSGYGLRSSDGIFTTVHSVVLENLNASTVYHYRVGSTDVAGNGPSYSADLEFRTIANPDNSPPKLSNIKVTSLTNNSAVITWTTDEPSTSIVEFGNSTLYGRKASSQLNVLQHSVLLLGLAPGTSYHYRVYSTDPTGNTASPSADAAFKTPKSAAAVSKTQFPWVYVALVILVVLAVAGIAAAMRLRRATPPPAPRDDVETLQMETSAPVQRKMVAPAPAAEILAPLTVPPPAPLRHIRCPHCRARIPIHREGPHGITCPNCGRSGYYRPKAVGSAGRKLDDVPQPQAPGPQRGAPVRAARCPSCGSEVPIYTDVYPVRITCPVCGRSGVFRGPGR